LSVQLRGVITMESFLTAVPDIPRWVEARGMLLGGEGRALGVEGPAVPTGVPSGVIVQVGAQLAAVVGQPRASAIQEAAALVDELLAVPENAAWVAQALPGWIAESAALHVLVDADRLPHVPDGSVRLLAPGELDVIGDMTDELREELAFAMHEGTVVAAALHDGRPVAFCYAGAVTEGWWDVSIDTLAPFRRQGYAARCATYMIRRMAQAGKRPIWGSAASNAASAGLAARLGFVAVDSLVVFSPAA
jgi:GNAT superfamily N-acetyltransferase